MINLAMAQVPYRRLLKKSVLVAGLYYLVSSVVAMAEVVATFTTGAIAEFSNNANHNRNAVALASSPRAIESVTLAQTNEEWGGTQGNDYDVSVTVNFYDGSTLQTTGNFNWVKNASGGGINYFGIIFASQPSDGFVTSAGYDRTYILPAPGYEATFSSLTSADNLDGSANFGGNEFRDLRALLNTNYGNAAGLSLVKSAALNDGGDGVDVGDTISYTFTVENIGGLTVTDITLTDSLANISLSGGPIASLAPGASDNSTFSGTYTITQTDIDNGGVRNTATVTGDGNGIDDVTDTSGTYFYLDQATDVVFNQTAALALVKTATLNDTDGSDDHSAGDTISYSFAVYNTGDQTVTGITISDPLVTVSGGPIDLASGASDTTTFTGTYTVTQSDVDAGSVTNSAYVSGTDANGWSVSDTSGTAQNNDISTIVTLTASPSIALIKGGVLNDGGNGANAGDTISYNFTVTNTGNVTLSNIRISDLMLGGILTGGPISLAPGATNRFSFTGIYTLTAADITAGSVSNTATVTGSSPGNTADVTDTSGTSETNDTNTIVSLNISPSIEGWKLSTITDLDSSGGLSAGDIIVYTISVKNTGNVVLTNVGVQSDTLEQADGTAPINTFSSSEFSIVLGSSTTLNPGEVARFRGSYAVAQADIDAGGLSNTATVSGVYNSTTYTDVTHDAADIDGTTTNASDPTENLVSNVAPTLTGPNSSTGATSAISVNENQTAVFSFSANEAVTWTISGDDAGKFSIDGSTGVLTFSSAPDYENPNDVGATSGNNTYVVVVTGEDAGGLTTSQTVTVTVLDLKGSLGGTVTDSDGSVATGVTVYLRDSNNNQLAATTTDSSGDYIFNNLSAASYVVEFVHPTKGSRGRSARGQNNGRYVQSIVLVEQNFTDVDGILIDPSGVVYNSLTRSPVSGAVVRLNVTRDDNSTRVEVQNAWLDASGGGGLSGQTTGADGEYAFILNGSAPSGIYDIVVTPPSAFIFESLAIPATSGPYAPGFGAGIETIQTQSTAPTGGDATTYYLEFDFEITSDVATTSNGVINNHIPLDPASAELTITKTADVTNLPTAVAGDVISYTITVENTGNVDVTGVTLTDALTSDEAWSASDSGDTDGTGTLNVGETWTYTASYTMSGADITAGSVENVAYVSGTPSTGGTVEAYSGTQGTASTAQSAPSSGNGVVTTLTAARLLPLIEEDMRTILRDDLVITISQQASQISGHSARALRSLQERSSSECETQINELLRREPILFDTGSASIRQPSLATIDRIAALLANCDRFVFEVGGHTDDVADEAFNLSLSKARASAVVSALHQLGVPFDALSAKGFGESQPIATNATESGRHLNRRVEFSVIDRHSRNDECYNSSNTVRELIATINQDGMTANGEFWHETSDCRRGGRNIYEGTLSYLRTDQGMEQVMANLSYRSEDFQTKDHLAGRFVGAYATNNDVTSLATGTIQGFGLNAGLYGARRYETGLYLDYYLGAAGGRHNFDLDFERIGGVVTADGFYTYVAAFAGAAVSGETMLGEYKLMPRAGFEGASSPGGDAEFEATRGAIEQSDSLSTGEIVGLRVFVEQRLDDVLPERSEKLAITPMVFCDRLMGETQNACGAGLSVDFSYENNVTGEQYGIELTGEKTKSSEMFGLQFNCSRPVFGGELSGTSSVSRNRQVSIGANYTLNF